MYKGYVAVYGVLLSVVTFFAGLGILSIGVHGAPLSIAAAFFSFVAFFYSVTLFEKANDGNGMSAWIFLTLLEGIIIVALYVGWAMDMRVIM